MGKYRVILPIWAAVIMVCGSCIKRPEAGFSYQPLKNPEAGDEIVFTNESLEALFFYWDFGNGSTSEEENPSIVYEKPGDYTVTLIAENKFRSDSVSQSILIKPPTVLDIYCFGSKGGPLVSGWVQVWKALEHAQQGLAPLQSVITDENGRARFLNLDARTYFVYLRKEVEGGIYEGGGGVGPLLLNKINAYTALINYFPTKKSVWREDPGDRNDVTVPFFNMEEVSVSPLK